MNIGDLFFSLRANDARLQADVKKAGDKAGTTLGQSMSASIRKSFSGAELGKGFVQGLGLAGALGAANLASTAVSGLVNVMKDAVQAAIEEEQSIAKLDTALRANVKGWDGNREAIEKVLQARIELGFSDDEQRQSLALLVAATKDYNRALAIQRTAMDLARFKGISLQEASEALVKVEGGQFRLLKSLGIQLKDNATQQDALNAVQAVALGQAEAYADTTGGKLLVAQVKFGEAMEQLGSVVLPLVADAANFVAEAIGGIQIALGAVGDAAKFVGDLAERLNLIDDPTTKTLHHLEKVSSARIGSRISKDFDDLATSATAAADAVEISADDILAAFQSMRSEIVGGGQAVADALYDPIIKAAELADTQAELQSVRQKLRSKNLTKDEVKELERRRQELGKQLIQQNAELLTYGTEAEQISKIKSFLASSFWAQAYKDATPEQAAALDDWRLTLQDRLDHMEQDAEEGGKNAGREFSNSLRSQAPAAGSAAGAVTSAADAAFNKAREAARADGLGTGAAYAAGLRASYGLVNDAAYYVGRAVGPLKPSSPPPAVPWIIDAGHELGAMWAGGIASAKGDVSAAAYTLAGGLSGLAAPGARSVGVARSGLSAGGAGGTRVQNNYVTIEGLIPYQDPLTIPRQLQRFGEAGVLDHGVLDD